MCPIFPLIKNCWTVAGAPHQSFRSSFQGISVPEHRSVGASCAFHEHSYHLLSHFCEDNISKVMYIWFFANIPLHVCILCRLVTWVYQGGGVDKGYIKVAMGLYQFNHLISYPVPFTLSRFNMCHCFFWAFYCRHSGAAVEFCWMAGVLGSSNDFTKDMKTGMWKFESHVLHLFGAHSKCGTCGTVTWWNPLWKTTPRG